MKTNNYFLHIILTILLCCAGKNVYAYSDIVVENADGVNIYYNYINDGTELEVTSGGYSGVVNIPSQVTYQGETMNVTSIGYRAFYECTSLTSVTIPNSITSISQYAFFNCTGLTSVTIPNSVTSIGYMAFYNCTGLTSVTIPNSVTSIGSGTFSGCSGLTSVTIPNSVTSIGESAFRGCSSLTSVTIPNSVTSIGSGTFSGCSSLTSVTISNSVTSIGSGTFSGCSGLTSITIPNSVTSIGDNTFGGCSGLTSVTIPNSVTSIGEEAFYGCSSLASVTIGNSVTYIGQYAFFNCTGLISVTIPNSVTSIGDSTFSGCSGLTSIVVKSGNTCYDSRDNCNAIIETATGTLILGCQTTIIPNSVTSIGSYAFSGCSGLTSVTIPNSVTSIGEYAFARCSGLTSITIGSNVRTIGKRAFYYCSGLTSVAIPNSMASIGDGAFRHCSGLTSVTISNSVASIGYGAFGNCTSLTSVTIGNSVTSIGEEAFEDCNKLLTIISRMVNVCTIPENCFEQYVYNNATLYVPQGKTYKYKAIDYWTKFLTIEEGEPSGVSGDGPEKCETPTITYSNGQLLFNTSTEGATCYYTITDNDVTNGCGDNISLCVTYNVKVYAWKSGYQNSDIATGTLCWIDTNPTTEGIINEVTQIPARAVFVQAHDGFINISGLGDSERVAIYQTDGKQVATAKAYNGNASVATNISRGTPVIVKIGEKAVKVVMQ